MQLMWTMYNVWVCLEIDNEFNCVKVYYTENSFFYSAVLLYLRNHLLKLDLREGKREREGGENVIACNTAQKMVSDLKRDINICISDQF